MKNATSLRRYKGALEWQIDRRCRIQELLWRMHSFLEQHAEFSDTDDDHWHAMNRMVGAGFSLWRSAFLTKATGDRKEVYKHTKTFLHRLLTHNSIQFTDDYNNSELSVVYYNNNARYRLERMYLHNSKLYQTPHSPAIQKLRSKETGDIEQIPQMKIWDSIFLGLRECFDAFEADWEKYVRPVRRSANRSLQQQQRSRKRQKKRS